MTESVTITKEEYEKLLFAKEMLLALMGAGVDNWEGYGEALRTLNLDGEDDE